MKTCNDLRYGKISTRRNIVLIVVVQTLYCIIGVEISIVFILQLCNIKQNKIFYHDKIMFHAKGKKCR